MFAKFGVDFDTSGLVQGNAAVDALIGRVTQLGNVVAGAAVVRGLRAFTADFVDQATEISDASQVLGMSSADLQAWRHAAQLAGVDAGALGGAFIRLQDGMSENAPAFRELGVATRDAAGQLRPVGDVLADLADPIAALSTDAERTGKLVDLLGRSGARLGPLFARGSEGMAEVRAELALLGGGATPEAIASADELGDAWDRLDAVSLSLKSRLAIFVLPVLERISAAAIAAGAAFTRMADKGYIVEASMLVLGTAAAAAGAKTTAAWIRAAAPFIAVGAAVLGLILIVEDLWLGFETGRGVIADLGGELEAWGEAQQGMLAPVVRQWEFYRGVLLSVLQAMHEITGFGFDLSGGDGDIAITNATDEKSQLTNAIVQERRAQSGGTHDMIPDSLERFDASQMARQIASEGNAQAAIADLANRAAARAQGGTTTVMHPVNIGRIDTSGLTVTQAGEMVEAAVRRAMSSEADDTLDALAGGV